jgi:hypothetical protein
MENRKKGARKSVIFHPFVEKSHVSRPSSILHWGPLGQRNQLCRVSSWSVKGSWFWRYPKFRCFHRKAISSLTQCLALLCCTWFEINRFRFQLVSMTTSCIYINYLYRNKIEPIKNNFNLQSIRISKQKLNILIDKVSEWEVFSLGSVLFEKSWININILMGDSTYFIDLHSSIVVVWASNCRVQV